MRRTEFAQALCLILALLLVSPGLARQDTAELELQLEALRAQIQQIQRRLDADLSSRDQVLAALAEAERALAAADLARRSTQSELESTNAGIDGLQLRIDDAGEQLGHISRQLAEQLRLAHRQGGQSRLQLLLNQDDPRRLSRDMAYHGYLSRARIELLLGLQTLLGDLAADRDELDAQRLHLIELQVRQREEVARMETARADRDAALAGLDQRIESQAATVAAMEGDAAELEALIEELTRALEDIPMDVEVPAITALRGELPRPLDGRIARRYGESRGGDLRWNGWLLSAATGTEVRAIAHGRIAYADWLRGYGMLLIIDHGDGVMSLYGHNESLLRHVGDWVAPGDTVATVGQSGGADEPALYFEIRHDGRPVNPDRWLARQ